MSEQKTKARGTKVTETIIGASANKMVMATKNLQDAATEALKLVATINENTLKIVDQEEKLTNLQTEFQNKRTQAKIDLDLAYKADQAQFANQYLSSNNLVAVPREEYENLQVSLEEWKEKFDEKVNAEVGKAKGIAESNARNAEKLAEQTYLAKEAQNIARIQTLEQQLAFATTQAKTWEQQLNSERQASIERSKSQSATVNVTGQNGR